MTLSPPVFSAIKSTCDAAAIATAWASAASIIGVLNFVQGLFGAIGAILSVVYLFYRIRSARRK